MRIFFADTFYWIALFSPRDSAHREAIGLAGDQSASRVVTTDEVLIECLNYFSDRSDVLRSTVSRDVRQLLTRPGRGVLVIPQTRSSFLAGLDLHAQRTDKSYSLTDCISMQTMRREGLTDVLTNDRHFEQEGFRAVFRGFRAS